MSNPMNKEKFIEILNESAVRRFGEEGAKSLSSAIQEIAASMAAIAAHEIDREEEPGFFL
ncbi:MAG: hypothetical protein ABSB32_10910 [Thermodesulfobacteriota bacterium]